MKSRTAINARVRSNIRPLALIRALPLLVAVSLPASAAAQATAQPDRAPPQPVQGAPQDGFAEKLESGLSHYDNERYKEAIAAFEGAYALHKQPRLLFLIGQAHRKLGQHKEAQARLREFLLLASPSKDAEFIRTAEDYLKRFAPPPAREQRGWLTVHSERRGALLLVDGKAAGRTPLTRLPLLAGLHQVSGRHEGQEASASIQVFPEREQIFTLRFPVRRYVWALTGVALGLAIAGAATGVGLHYGLSTRIPDGRIDLN